MLFKRMNKKTLISNIVAIALLVAFSILINGAITLKSLVNWILIYSISALALNIICGCLGEFVLGHGGFLLIGYTVAVLVGQLMVKVCGADFIKEYIYMHRGQHLYLLGYVVTFLSGQLGFFLCIVLPVLIYTIWQIYRLVVAITQNQKQKILEEASTQTSDELKQAIINEYLAKQKALEEAKEKE